MDIMNNMIFNSIILIQNKANRSIYTMYEINKYCAVNISPIMEWIDTRKLEAFKTPNVNSRALRHELIKYLLKYSTPIPQNIKPFESKKPIVNDNMLMMHMITKIIKKIFRDVEVEHALDGFLPAENLNHLFKTYSYWIYISLKLMDYRYAKIFAHKVTPV